ncbi:hypothetical protein HHL23_16965 [Chryseobacterium sp. RP-3-3]|uniref:Uncharacterized protein n=1 Tax=Chryseobacterium antibioticum TaxID=2728847 RepID=A0A7Y0AQ91_9FLAO|nr:hypothetical protein [Chryseobacterium antibioticum]NML71483.1 hypothetical protein [Chryseobacterium antibioticum]
MKNELLTKGFLWNINGLASVFCSLLNDEKFIEEYNMCRMQYLQERNIFLEQMKTLPVKIYDSSANFF